MDPADYMLAICGNDALRELSSPGKSGSFFYLTQDDRFMIKTVKKSEVKVSFRATSVIEQIRLGGSAATGLELSCGTLCSGAYKDAP